MKMVYCSETYQMYKNLQQFFPSSDVYTMKLQTSHTFDVKHNTFVTAATSRMTEFDKFHRSQTSIEVTWRRLVIPPKWIALKFNCRHIINTTLFIEKKILLHPNRTSLKLNDIIPGTECHFVLNAVYNPASIDNGIRTSCKTLPYSKRIMFQSFGVECDLYTA